MGSEGFEIHSIALSMFHVCLQEGVLALLGRALSWPLQRGRAPITITVTSLLLALGLMIWARRRQPEAAAPRLWIARGWRLAGLQFVSVWTIVALILGSTNLNVHAQVYNPVFYYYLPDHLGSSQILVDRSGERVQHYENTAYGKQRFQDNASAFGMSHRFTGQIFDDETGLYYFGARYYDPELGRFTQPDTVVPQPYNPQTLNRYAYCIGNPLKYTDPSGNLPLLVGIIVGAAIGAATSAATGGDIGMGALTGAIGGLFSGIGSAIGGLGGSLVGGATGGAVTAAVTGGNVGMGALVGSFSAGIRWAVNSNVFDRLWRHINNAGNWVLGHFPSLIGVPLGHGMRALAGFGSALTSAIRGDLRGSLAGVNQGLRGVSGVLGVEQAIWEDWIRAARTTQFPLPESLAQDMADVENALPGDAGKNGMHAWHAGSNAALARRLGPVLAPFQWLGGFVHETPLDWGSFSAEQSDSGTINHILDSLTDIIANSFGMAAGYALPASVATGAGISLGNVIPGPGERAHAFGGEGPYRGHPSHAWGPYP